jgi:hypothetical protein
LIFEHITNLGEFRILSIYVDSGWGNSRIPLIFIAKRELQYVMSV